MYGLSVIRQNYLTSFYNNGSMNDQFNVNDCEPIIVPSAKMSTR